MATTYQNMDSGESYRPLTGLIYIFNLIVGTGALTLPRAFSDAGWLLSILIIVLIAFMSYVTVTFIIETMSISNAIIRHETNSHTSSRTNTPRQSTSLPNLGNGTSATANNEIEDHMINHDVDLQATIAYSDFGNTEEKVPLMGRVNGEQTQAEEPGSIYEISRRIEFGKMAKMYFSNRGVNVFYICMTVYLYGDLAIYGAAIAKSMRDVTCTYQSPHCNISSLVPSDFCWEAQNISRQVSYRVYVVVVLFCLGPFAFFNVQKTKYLQILTTFFRWMAFSSMIVLSIVALGQGKGKGTPKTADILSVPSLFGVCVYSFMCHHSLPALVTPISQKKRIFWLVFADYLMILVFYALLGFTAVFTFKEIEDVYTLNFKSSKCAGDQSEEVVPHISFFQYFLPLFPVFTLSTNFPIIAITLTNNLRTLVLTDWTTERLSPRQVVLLNKFALPLTAVVPPIIVAIITEDLELLVGLIGSYAGASIQYFIPAFLVFYARKSTYKLYNDNDLSGLKNRYRSPFKSVYWVYFIILWAIICVVFVTVNNILKAIKGFKI